MQEVVRFIWLLDDPEQIQIYREALSSGETVHAYNKPCWSDIGVARVIELTDRVIGNFTYAEVVFQKVP